MTQSTLTDIMVALRSNPEHKDSGLTVVTMETAHIQNGFHLGNEALGNIAIQIPFACWRVEGAAIDGIEEACR